MKNLLIVVFHFFLIMCNVAQAASSHDEDMYYNEISRDYSKADKELNHLYTIQIQQYRKEGADFYGQAQSRDVFLKESQQAWIKMRDVSCNYETYESRTGAGFSGIYIKCLLDKTNERIRYLKLYN
ncbi:lysozyme inhibitor LprI family protein [Cronobacter universalis]|uniref:lysozyme inhibitor LprI family protein n=1 Tax=Cronobacter universalis TaxID=535744 RepID=UPI003CEF9128